MGVERGLVGPTFQQDQLVRGERTLKNLELLAAGLLHALFATRPESLRKLGPFSRFGRDRDDESNCHNPSYACARRELSEAVRSRYHLVKDRRSGVVRGTEVA